MTADPRAALALLVAAFERHLEVSSNRRDPDDPHVVAAALDLADAFDDYDEALFLATEVMTPLVVDADDEDDDDDDGDDDEDADALPDTEQTGVYSGLEDDDLEYEDDSDDDDDADDDDDDDADDDDDEDDEDDEDDDFDDEDEDDDDAEVAPAR